MNRPHRIQLRRTKGWRKPEGVVVVSRPSRWGNDHIPIQVAGHGWGIARLLAGRPVYLPGHICETRQEAVAETLRLYELGWLIEAEDQNVSVAQLLDPLAGRDLACWCALDEPCHADVLLRLANPADP